MATQASAAAVAGAPAAVAEAPAIVAEAPAIVAEAPVAVADASAAVEPDDDENDDFSKNVDDISKLLMSNNANYEDCYNDGLGVDSPDGYQVTVLLCGNKVYDPTAPDLFGEDWADRCFRDSMFMGGGANECEWDVYLIAKRLSDKKVISHEVGPMSHHYEEWSFSNSSIDVLSAALVDGKNGQKLLKITFESEESFGKQFDEENFDGSPDISKFYIILGGSNFEVIETEYEEDDGDK